MAKMHLMRTTRTTWCGLTTKDHPSLKVTNSIGVASLEFDSCKTCTKADRAEQLRNGATS